MDRPHMSSSKRCPQRRLGQAGFNCDLKHMRSSLSFKPADRNQADSPYQNGLGTFASFSPVRSVTRVLMTQGATARCDAYNNLLQGRCGLVTICANTPPLERMEIPQGTGCTNMRTETEDRQLLSAHVCDQPHGLDAAHQPHQVSILALGLQCIFCPS